MWRKTIHQAVYQGWQVNFFQIQVDRCWCRTSSLLMGNSCLWGGLNCGTCRFPHPPGNLSPAIYCYRTNHITRERDMYNLGIGGVLCRKNLMTCANTLMNGHWEGLVGKVEELLHATNHPDNNYRMLIQQIIQYSSDGEQCLESCTWESVGGTWTGSSSVSGCASTLVDLQQRLGDRAWWIYGWINRRPIVNRVFNQVLRDHPDLHDAVNAQVSILCQSFKWFVLKNGDHG